ncbi:MAG: hypothetical protein Ct9H300mP1_12780 [Planctomycetaceae bacterium]|nr:MAG: hypothetical protein Ct9H300mP1_12780 [Planctomycetaceae bacterium]
MVNRSNGMLSFRTGSPSRATATCHDGSPRGTRACRRSATRPATRSPSVHRIAGKPAACQPVGRRPRTTIGQERLDLLHARGQTEKVRTGADQRPPPGLGRRLPPLPIQSRQHETVNRPAGPRGVTPPGPAGPGGRTTSAARTPPSRPPGPRPLCNSTSAANQTSEGNASTRFVFLTGNLVLEQEFLAVEDRPLDSSWASSRFFGRWAT